MRKKIIGIFVCTLMITFSLTMVGTSVADWDPEDEHKMHFPQLPDPYGWDIYATSFLPQLPNTHNIVLADDFECSETGYIKDIHFWGSWKLCIVGEIDYFVIGVAEDLATDSQEIPYSRPGETLIKWEIHDWAESPVDTSDIQGWYEPHNDYWNEFDHSNYFQYNVFLDEEDWFYQEEGTFYWLFITAYVKQANPGLPQPLWGWKTSDVSLYPEPYMGKHYRDDAVWNYWTPYSQSDWVDIFEPPIVDPVTNTFFAQFGPGGQIYDVGGTDYYDNGKSFNGWYYYPETEWWNIWFYDHPFDQNRGKRIDISFDLYKMFPEQDAYVKIAINWANENWPADSPPPVPPIENEELYIERDVIFEGKNFDEGHYDFTSWIREYNPEWVSVDVIGYNFNILKGIITHDCLRSLDLAFVITGGGKPCVDIDKTVSVDGGTTWMEEVDMEIYENVKFKLDIHNCGEVDLTDILIKDTLPDCLEYVINSATPVEPMIDGNILYWTSGGPLKPCNHIYITFDARVTSTGENENEAKVTANGDGTIVTHTDTAIVNGIQLIPDLSCEGELIWSKLKPGSVVSGGEIKLKNIGDPGSKLHWRITEWPDWGTWDKTEFHPSEGVNLKPEDGELTITINPIGIPDKKGVYTGKIKIINMMDPDNDYCELDVTVRAQKVKPKLALSEYPIIKLLHQFPLLKQIFCQILYY